MIRVGTCSWTEKTLIQSGEFYPAGMNAAEQRLRHYSTWFDTVEVDSTYYAPPSPQTAALWADRTPAGFTFHIKVYGAMTGHGVSPATLPKDIRAEIPEKEQCRDYIYVTEPSLLGAIFERFISGVQPLHYSGKLGLFVFQFPPWFRRNTASIDYIMRCRELMQGMPMAVEFRHGSWMTPEARGPVFKLLSESGLAHVTAEEPQYGSLATVPFVPEATTDIAYFRFHGRNRQNWLKKGIETSLRYDYLYSDAELNEFIPALRRCSEKTKVTYAMFNNCHGSSSVRNAAAMKELLAGSV